MKKRFLLLLLVLCLVCTDSVFWPPNKAAAESEYPWAVSHVTYDVTYDAILKLYLKIINGYKTKDYGRHDLFNDFVFWDLFVEDPDPQKTVRYIKNTLGFYIDDMNQDGVDELVILMTGGYIYEVFTMDEGRVRELIRAGGRYNCRRLNDNTFLRWCFRGAPDNSYEIWKMNGTVMMLPVKNRIPFSIVEYTMDNRSYSATGVPPTMAFSYRLILPVISFDVCASSSILYQTAPMSISAMVI